MRRPRTQRRVLIGWEPSEGQIRSSSGRGGKPVGFTVACSSGNVTGQGAPAAFASTFIGGNGNISGGTYSTWSDSGLPKQVSAITSVKSSFGWGGGSGDDFQRHLRHLVRHIAADCRRLRRRRQRTPTSSRVIRRIWCALVGRMSGDRDPPRHPRCGAAVRRRFAPLLAG